MLLKVSKNLFLHILEQQFRASLEHYSNPWRLSETRLKMALFYNLRQIQHLKRIL